ncbi:MAG: cytochrome c [Magnetococcales bacterium]|nr:cytochrome c [Magnetococcales bacterium]
MKSTQTIGHSICVALVGLIGTLVAVNGSAAESLVTQARQNQLVHLLRHDCGSCHGMTLKGGLGPPLLPENLVGKDAQWLEDVIHYGVPERAMPPWEGLLTRAEIRWLVEQLLKGEIP